MSDDNPLNADSVQGRILGVPLSADALGKCSSCGFLSRTIRSRLATTYKEIDWFARLGVDPILGATSGEFDRSGSENPHIECFLHVINMPDEIGLEMGRRGGNDWAAAALQVISKDRQCPEWFLYSPGMNPKRHFARYEMQRREQDRRNFELKLAAMTQSAEEAHQRAQEDSKLILADSRELARDNTRLVAEIKTIAEQSDRFSKRITWLVIFLGAVQALSSLVGLYLAYRASQNREIMDMLERLLTR